MAEVARGVARACALSVVVPVFNAERTIGRLVRALSGLTIDGGMEIILVNDGSRDDSLRVCRTVAEGCDVPVTVVDLARNFGEHNAVMAGLHHARGDYVVTMDDDLQNPPEEVERLFAHARVQGRDVVYACYAEHRQSWWRNLGSAFTNWCSDRLLDKPKGLYLSSFRCMSAFAVSHVVAHTSPYPYIDGILLQVTQNVDRLLVGHLPRVEGRTNYTLRRLVRLWLSMFLGFSVLPLRIGTMGGLVIAALGAFGLLAVFVEAILGRPPQGWASLMAAVLLLAGVQLTMLGVIGEYLGRLFLTANGRPQFVVRHVARFRSHQHARESVQSPPRPRTWKGIAR